MRGSSFSHLINVELYKLYFLCRTRVVMKHDAYFYTQQQYFIICLRHLRHTNYILPRYFYSISLVRFIEVDMRCKFQRKMQLKVTSTYCGTRCIVANWDLSLFVSLVVLLQRHSDLRFKEKWPFYVFSKRTFKKIHFTVNGIFVR